MSAKVEVLASAAILAALSALLVVEGNRRVELERRVPVEPKELYRTLAENAAEDARRPAYRLWSAEWLWRASGGPVAPGDVVARFRAAITEAALYGDPATAEAAAGWFRERGMAVPEPDLEGEEGGG